MVMCYRFFPTFFLLSNPGFQDVLFVLCLHTNQYTYAKKELKLLALAGKSHL